MKQLSRIMPTYAFDISGVCSALYELGGMVVMHDASGCNSSYTTFDEPRWYDMDSMIYGSGLDETDAMLGNDERLVADIVKAASEMHPRFIAIAGGPVPMMIGTDFTGIAQVVEKRTGIPAFGFYTNGMNFYPYGAGLAFKALAGRFCKKEGSVRTRSGVGKAAVNLIGVTPLDFSVGENVPALKSLFLNRGYPIVSVWAMGSRFDEIESALAADVNVAVSSCGLPAAKYFHEKYGIPYVAGLPVGNRAADELFLLVDRTFSDKRPRALLKAAPGLHESSSDRKPGSDRDENAKILIIGEQVYADSLRCCLAGDYGFKTIRTLCPLDPDTELLLPGDVTFTAEEDIEREMAEQDIVIADPLYRYLLPREGGPRMIDMPHEAFSGRIYREKIPCVIGEKIHAYLRKFL